MEETFTIIPTEFSIRIIETGFIDNVKLYIGIYNTQIEIPCKHQKRFVGSTCSDLFSCEYCFPRAYNSAYYFFKYTIEANCFETKKVFFNVVNLFV